MNKIDKLFDTFLSKEHESQSDVLREACTRGMKKETEQKILENERMLYVPSGRDF